MNSLFEPSKAFFWIIIRQDMLHGTVSSLKANSLIEIIADTVDRPRFKLTNRSTHSSISWSALVILDFYTGPTSALHPP